MVVADQRSGTLQSVVRENVEPGSQVFTDALLSYQGLNGSYVHAVIDHAVAYCDGEVHTNSMENFWSLLKRTLGGTYVSVFAKHLDSYLDEQCRRFNDREMKDGDRFYRVMRDVVGKRLSYAELTA